MIELTRVTKRYGERPAVNDISFKVEKGEIVGFLGPNGAGKTTTMRMITGYLAPSEGSIRVGGVDVFERPIEVKKRIGYLPETPPLYHEMTVASYLDFVAQIRLVPKAKRKEARDRALERCGLTNVAHRVIGHLSKGYRQRVGLGQALIHEPDVLIMDEPTVGLDPQQIIEIRDLIKGFAGSHTVILSTHILQEVHMTCQRVLIINEGRIVAQDSLEKLASKAANGNQVLVTLQKHDEGLIKKLRQMDGVVNVREHVSLEEIYVNLISGRAENTGQKGALV